MGRGKTGGKSSLQKAARFMVQGNEQDPDVKTEEERRQRFGQIDHNRVFGRKAGELLEQAGFAVESIRGEDCPEEILPVIGPADYDRNILFWCMRR